MRGRRTRKFGCFGENHCFDELWMRKIGLPYGHSANILLQVKVVSFSEEVDV